MIPSSVECTCDQGSEGVPYSLDLSIQMLDEHWYRFSSHAENIDCYNISSGVRGNTCRLSILTSFSDIFWSKGMLWSCSPLEGVSSLVLSKTHKCWYNTYFISGWMGGGVDIRGWMELNCATIPWLPVSKNFSIRCEMMIVGAPALISRSVCLVILLKDHIELLEAHCDRETKRTCLDWRSTLVKY